MAKSRIEQIYNQLWMMNQNAKKYKFNDQEKIYG